MILMAKDDPLAKECLRMFRDVCFGPNIEFDPETAEERVCVFLKVHSNLPHAVSDDAISVGNCTKKRSSAHAGATINDHQHSHLSWHWDFARIEG